MSALEALAHDGESLLAKVRDGSLTMNRTIADALFELEDAVRSALATIAEVGADGDLAAWSDLRRRLADLAATSADGASELPRAIVFDRADERRDELADGAQPGLVTSPPEETTLGEPHDSHASQADRSTPQGSGQHRPAVTENAVRVDVGLLDRLMNLVGELVLARNRVLQLAQGLGNTTLAVSTQQLSIITSELQEQVMKTRMQPIDTLLSKLPRMVRDLAHELGREVDLVLEGRETELDRTIVDAIRDPLTHLIRNAVDHGIEPPEEREAVGKPRRGTLRIEAYHEGGYVLIEVRDDGRGLDLQRVRERAVARGLVSAEELARMSPREVSELIFLPGFSTARTVSAVSGRGVGMDVVKTNVEGVGGSIDVESELGHGTCFRLRIPLTLAIIPALMVETGAQRFAIPQLALSELVRLERGERESLVEVVDRAPVLRRRDQLVPLLDLGALLGLDPVLADPKREAVSVVVLQLGGTTFGLAVDRIVDTQEIVVKPLGQFVNQLPCYSGATILGDGRVALILDVSGLARLGGLTAERAREVHEQVGLGSEFDTEPILVVAVGGGERVGIWLRAIERLEEFPLEAIEHLEGREVVQYRGGVMVLVHLSHLLGLPSQPTRTDRTSVVVASDRSGKVVGLAVDDVLDIAAAPHREPGATVVVGGKLVRIVDLAALLELAAEVSHV